MIVKSDVNMSFFVVSGKRFLDFDFISPVLCRIDEGEFDEEFDEEGEGEEGVPADEHTEFSASAPPADAWVVYYQH